MILSDRDTERYDRQITIEEIGKKGQKKLHDARIVIAGAGGLGSAVSIYLAAAGIGHITLIDHERVDLSNLNRQILYGERDVGKGKAKTAVKKLQELNSDIEIRGEERKITEETVMGLVENTDAIVDCMDNFRTRFILNDAAVEMNIPFFHGACEGFEGRATTIIPQETPCLRCIMPTSPPEKKVPVLGTTPGTIGTIQATEVIKFFTGISPILTNKLLLYSGKDLQYTLIDVERNLQCPSCGG